MPFQQQAERHNMYTCVHKGIRALMQHTLYEVGRCDWRDDLESDAAAAQLRAMMELMYSHLHHEDVFIHAAMEARRPGSAMQTSGDHHEHVLAIKAFLAGADALGSAEVEERTRMGADVYRRLGLFVSENLEHMVVEETDNNAVLWACYSDEELRGIEHALVSSIPAERHGQFLRWMLPAMNTAERTALLAGARQGMPPEVFQDVLGNMRPLLSERDWYKLMEGLGIGRQSAQEALAA
ncbi:hypothetical protein [Uliginosibacterium sp. H1]|uniref:hypothetical protein n=1 Tax=Uliginosibacterium sp. H1 TaxID=3114757 RepID=UPI002E17AAAB|nr:hypothetical protein [Uliginosibacterium sp. H1]